MSDDNREWTIYRPPRHTRGPHIIDGEPTAEGEVRVVPRSRLERAEAERDRLREALEEIEACNRSRKCAACRETAADALKDAA